MKRLLCIILSTIVLAFSLCSCKNESKATDEMFALDTIITFTIYDNDESLCESTIALCKSEVLRLEALLSATKKDSDVYNINRSGGEKVKVAKETATLLQRAKELSKSTKGAFDVSIYPLVKLWGFDTKAYKVPQISEITQALSLVSYKEIKIDGDFVEIEKGMSVDLGAIAKGYIGERLFSILKNQGISRGIVNLGGMVITYCEDEIAEDFTIGVEYPDSGEVFATFNSQEGFTVTSGAYQRYFEEDGKRYHHIIDPKSGKPSDSDISSVTIITKDAVSGDALSTAFFVMGIEKTLEYINSNTDTNGEKFEVIILNSNKNEAFVSSSLLENGFGLEGKFENRIKINVINAQVK